MKTLIYALTLFGCLGSASTLQAANRYWIASSSANWNNAANWSASSGGAGGATVPAANDIANFNNLGLGSCTITASVSISSLIMYNGYTGTITQGANTVSIGGAASFSGGTWLGGSGTMTIGGAVTFTGGNFTFPSVINMNGNAWTYTSGILDPLTNSSTVVFSGTASITGSQTMDNITLNNTTPWTSTYLFSAATTLTIDGNITMGGTSGINFSGGTIDLLGNLSLNNTGTGGGGSTVLTFTGTTNQAITGSPAINESALPSVTINKASGTLTFPALLTMAGTIWTYTTGTLDVTTNNSTVAFGNNTTITGTQTLNNITFINTTPWPMTYTLSTGTTLTANGNMAFSGTAAQTFTGGTIDLLGNLALSNTGTGGGGTTVIAFTGTTAQAITGSLTLDQSSLPSVNIDKSSGTLTFPALLTMTGSTWTYTMGTLDVTTNSSTVIFGGNTTITGTHTLNNIDFDNSTPWPITDNMTAGTTVTAGGSMTISGISSLTFNGGTIDVLDNLMLTNTGTGGGGSTVIAFTGTAAQAITSSLTIDQSSLPSVNIDKASGTLTFPALLTMAGSTWTYTMGTLDVTTNGSTIVFGGNTTITGTHTLNNIDFDNSTPWSIYFTISTGTTVTASGNMTMSGISSLTLNGTGIIDLLGNLILTNTATGGGGSAVIDFIGTTAQAITSSLAIDQSSLPSVTIDKVSGTLTFPTLITMAGSAWTFTTGALDVTTNNSTVVFGGNTTITGTHKLNNIDFDNSTPWSITYIVSTGTTLTAGGTTTMSGGSAEYFTGGTVALLGNLDLTNTSTGDQGTTVFAFTGTVNQAIVSALPIKESSLPSVTINKASGTLSFPSIITMSGSVWLYTAGTVDAATNASTVYFVYPTSISANGMNFYNLEVYTNTSTLGSNLSVSNNLTIVSPGVLSGSTYTINLSGNWSDWGTGGFTESGSTVNFAGSSVQTITTPGGENFAGLTVNNSSGIQLVNNITVSKTLTLTQGNMNLSGNTLTTGISTGTPGTLTWTSGTIFGSGSITRWFKAGAIAVGSGLFPTGTNTDYRPFSVSTTASPTTGGTMTMVYTDGTSTAAVSFADGASTVLVRKSLNWALSTAGLVGGTYNLEISGTNFGTIGSVSDLRLTLFGSVVGTAGVNAGTTSDPQVNRTGVTLTNLSNTFYLSSINPIMTTLPVSLISFTAAPSNGEVVLDWATAAETNSSYYTIQRSADGVSWQDLQQVAAAGTSNSLLNYTAYDPAPLAGASDYRLMMTDMDGGITYSSIQSVNFSISLAAISVYPNPATSYLDIRFAHSASYEVTLLNDIGQTLVNSGSPNGNNLVLNVSALRPGIYFVRINGDGGTIETKEILIKR